MPQEGLKGEKGTTDECPPQDTLPAEPWGPVGRHPALPNKAPQRHTALGAGGDVTLT